MNPKLWNDMFTLGVPLAEKILRPVIVYFFLVIALRLAGKRELAQLNPFDLVVLISLSNTVQNAMIGEDNSVLGGLIGAASLLGINFLLVRFLYRHPKLGELVEGRAEVLVQNGKVHVEQLKKNMITMEQLTEATNRQGCSIDDVERAVLQPGGGITIVPKHLTPETARHREVLKRLDEITHALEQLHGGRQLG